MMVHHTKKVHIDIFFIYGLSVCLVIIISLVSLVNSYQKGPIFLPQEEKQVIMSMFDKEAFKDIQTEANAYVVYDLLSHEVIASKNETLILPLASITKVMTAVSAVLHKKESDTIIITQKSIEDSYDLGLKKDQVWSLKELLRYTLVFSSNDGAQAVADSFGGTTTFIKQMNTDASLLGLSLIFTDPAGRDIGQEVGGKGTALDVAKLFGIARKNIPDLLDATTKKRSNVTTSTGRLTGIPNTNQDVETLPGVEGSKTGFTDLAGGNLGVVVDITIGHPVVLVVLGSSREGRFEDMRVLYNALQKSLTKQTPSYQQAN